LSAGGAWRAAHVADVVGTRAAGEEERMGRIIRQQVPVPRSSGRLRALGPERATDRTLGVGFGPRRLSDQFFFLLNGGQQTVDLGVVADAHLVVNVGYVMSVAIAGFGANLVLRVCPDHPTPATAFAQGETVFTFFITPTFTQSELDRLVERRGSRLVWQVSNALGVSANFIVRFVTAVPLADEVLADPLGSRLAPVGRGSAASS
jgi:hypothetical protein